MASDTHTKHGKLHIWRERIGMFGPAILLAVVAFAVAGWYFLAGSEPG